MKRKTSKDSSPALRLSGSPARKGGGKASRDSSPARRLSGSPTQKGRGKEVALTRARSETVAPGAWTVLYLREPREKFFAALLQMEPAGVWVRGIELESFESWTRERAAQAESSLGLSTFFVPFLRVEKMVVDEPMGPVPSFAQRFEGITGRNLDEALQV